MSQQQNKYFVAIKSKPGLSHPVEKIMQLEADDEKQAIKKAIQKMKTGKYKFRGPECRTASAELIKVEENAVQE